MNQTQTLYPSIGDEVPGHRFSRTSYAGLVVLHDKPVSIHVTRSALRAVSESRSPVLAELELNSGCLVRKQVRFREFLHAEADTADYPHIVPGLYTCFRAVTTQHCKVADVGAIPPVETMPVRKNGRFVPDWVGIDHRPGRWLGQFGFARNG